MDSLQERVRSAGMKLTSQRQLLLKVLLHHPEPISADEIFRQVEGEEQGMDLVTIYRILKKFEDASLVSRLEFGDGISRFELTLESGHHHHHVICRVCQKVEALHLCDLGPHTQIVKKMGYSEISHRLEFFGVCASCKET